MNLTLEDLKDIMYENIELTPSLARELKLSKLLRDKNRIYNISIRDPHFLAKKLERDSIIDKAKWSLSDVSSTEYVRERLWSILSNNKLKSIHEALYKGLSVHEIIYDSNNKVIDLVDLSLNDLRYVNQDGIEYIYKLDNNKKGNLIDHDKIIIANSNLFINKFPIGLSEVNIDLLAAKYITTFKQLLNYNESIAIPTLWGKYESESDKDSLIEAVSQIGRYSRGVLPKSCDIEFLESKNSSTTTFFDTISMIEDNISRSIIGVVNSGENNTGSYSALESQLGIKYDLISNSLDIVCDSINKYLIPVICDEIKSIDYPEFSLTLPNSRNIDTDVKLYSMGIRFSDDFLMENYGLSKNDFTRLTE